MHRTLLTAFSLLLIAAACKSTGVDRSEGTAQAMRQMKSALEDAPAKINAVTASLEELSEEGGDMKAEFAAFTRNVDALSSHRERVRSLRADVESNKAVFTSEWEKGIQVIKNEDLRQRAVERREAVVARFAEVAEVADEGKQEFEPWMEKVLDLRSYLENDLNPSGVDSVSDVVREISDGATSVHESITTLLEELDEIAEAIAAAKPPVETPDKGQGQ